MSRSFLPSVLAVALTATFAAPLPAAVLDDRAGSLSALTKAITPQSLRGHVSFLASDLLEGRDTPSDGLDIAAEYIAAQFRRIGLEPIGDDGYFQTNVMSVQRPSPDDFAARVRCGDDEWSISGSLAFVLGGPAPIDRRMLRLVWVDFADPNTDVVEAVGAPFIALTEMLDPSRVPATDRSAFMERLNRFTQLTADAGAVAILTVEPSDATPGRARRRTFDSPVPVFRLVGESMQEMSEKIRVGKSKAAIDLRYQPPGRTEHTVRNVVGLLPGYDPLLSSEYIIVSAHYDHLGRGRPVEGDDIYNGANDNASGTAAVMQVAEAFVRAGIRPRRSIVFICFYGEERGLLGSRFYVENPLVPLADTVANVNFEHLGRTDDVEGESKGRIMPTGYGYSDMIDPFRGAAEDAGFEIVHHPLNSDRFFGASDNAAFAAVGIPAHTFCTVFIFPDYHQPGDRWERLDYDNMAGAVQALALGLLRLADQDERPQWNSDHRRTGRFIQAQESLR